MDEKLETIYETGREDNASSVISSNASESTLRSTLSDTDSPRTMSDDMSTGGDTIYTDITLSTARSSDTTFSERSQWSTTSEHTVRSADTGCSGESKWATVSEHTTDAEDDEEEAAFANVADDEDEEDEDEENEDEENEDEEEVMQCLFCNKRLKGSNQALEHLSEHEVNLQVLQQRFSMDQYAFLKMINYIRYENITPKQLMSIKEPLWSDDKYLKPKAYEAWLTIDYEHITKAPPAVVAIEEMKEQCQQIVECARADIEKMRGTLERMIQDMPSNQSKNAGSQQNSVGNKSLAADAGYFSSYDHYSIHHEMLSDKVRTISYKNALLRNSRFIQDKVVLDLGCGTGILSIFASQAGARIVVGIDNSDIIYEAIKITKAHKIENISLIKGRLEDTILDIEKYDIIISEWMGYFLLFEGMLDSVIHARERHLKPGGVILPNRCNISLLGYGDDQLFENYVSFWDDVYGINMSGLRKKVLLEPIIEITSAEHILTNAKVIADFNMLTVDLDYSNFDYEFNLKCIKDGTLSAFVGYFDTFFDMLNPVSFSTGPKATPTHWKQCIFLMENPIPVKNGDIINGIFSCRRSLSNARSLDIMIKTNGQTYKYYFD